MERRLVFIRAGKDRSRHIDDFISTSKEQGITLKVKFVPQIAHDFYIIDVPERRVESLKDYDWVNELYADRITGDIMDRYCERFRTAANKYNHMLLKREEKRKSV